MAGNSRMTSEQLIPQRPKKNCNHFNRNGINRNPIINNSPDRSPVWIEPNSKTTAASAVMLARKVPVLYYLTRNGHLEHPHLIDVPISSPHGLYLRDIMNTLNYHRGQAMASMYSWSFKRSYKNGYVWHDASADDLIQPTNGNDYVLKGSELLQTHASQNPPDTNHIVTDCSPMKTPAVATIKRRNLSWSSFDNPQEYLVVKCESNRELAAKFAADAGTQTDEQRRRQSFGGESKEHVSEHVTVELSGEEMPSSPPSNSSSEVSEGVNGAGHVDRTVSVRDRDRTVENQHGTSGRMKASQVLMQLISCGASAVKDVSTIRGVR